ncbi:MAG: MFS transporter [Nanoarchaeota archaeon]|nr:MFS transporter [Nanoarchaeota archaeon]MBU4124324.1 MFS transporter [Nanoarchaeota archaeon]
MSNYNANIWKMYIFKFMSSFHLIGAVMVPFFTEWGNISFSQIMILQSWFMLWMFILEIPTGTVADFIGRKQSLVLGAMVTAIAALVYISSPNFYIFLLAEFLWAVGGALVSGADEAFTYDTLKKLGKTSISKKIFGRIDSLHLTGIMIAAPIGSVVAANFGLTAPMMLTAVPISIAALIGLTFKEPKVTRKIESKRYLLILKEGMKYFYKSKVLKILALDMIVIATISYYMIWLYQPMLKGAGVDIMYFGIVHSAFVASQILIMNYNIKLEKLLGSKRRLIFLSALITGIMFIVGGLTNMLPLVLLSIIVGGGFGLSRKPLFASYINKHIPSSKRATVLSTIYMLRQFAIAVVNPIVGLAVEWSLGNTLIILGVIAVIFSFISRIEEKHLLD